VWVNIKIIKFIVKFKLHLPEILPELGVFMCVLINWLFVFIVVYIPIDKYLFIVFSISSFIG